MICVPLNHSCRGGSIELESGSSEHVGAGNIDLKTGKGSVNEEGGNINIIASTNAFDRTWSDRGWNHNNNDPDKPKEINFGFDVSSD